MDKERDSKAERKWKKDKERMKKKREREISLPQVENVEICVFAKLNEIFVRLIMRRFIFTNTDDSQLFAKSFEFCWKLQHTVDRLCK